MYCRLMIVSSVLCFLICTFLSSADKTAADSFYRVRNEQIKHMPPEYETAEGVFIYTQSIILSNDGKEFIALESRRRTEPGNGHNLVHVAGFLAKDENCISIKTKVSITEYKPTIFNTRTDTIPGYRDPHGKFFLFLGRNNHTVYLLCFSQTPDKNRIGNIEILKKMAINNRADENICIKAIKPDNEQHTVALHFEGTQKRSITIDLKTKKIIQQKQPLPLLSISYNSAPDRLNLVKLINQAAEQEPWMKNFCKLSSEDPDLKWTLNSCPQADLYLPSLVLCNDNTHFKALGIAPVQNPKEEALSMVISGTIYPGTNMLTLKPSKKTDIDKDDLYPFQLRFYNNDVLPGFCDSKRRVFIFCGFHLDSEKFSLIALDSENEYPYKRANRPFVQLASLSGVTIKSAVTINSATKHNNSFAFDVKSSNSKAIQLQVDLETNMLITNGLADTRVSDLQTEQENKKTLRRENRGEDTTGGDDNANDKGSDKCIVQ